MTIREFAEQVCRLTGATPAFEHHPLPEDDPQRRRPDITKARNLLGWEPRVPLEEGLRRTIEYFRARS
jgi:dTDP-glucose 4,6-dehydratase